MMQYACRQWQLYIFPVEFGIFCKPTPAYFTVHTAPVWLYITINWVAERVFALPSWCCEAVPSWFLSMGLLGWVSKPSGSDSLPPSACQPNEAWRPNSCEPRGPARREGETKKNDWSVGLMPIYRVIRVGYWIYTPLKMCMQIPPTSPYQPI